MIDLNTSSGTVAISPIHVIGLIPMADGCLVLTDHPGEYSEITAKNRYETLRTLLEDELYGYERKR